VHFDDQSVPIELLNRHRRVWRKPGRHHQAPSVIEGCTLYNGIIPRFPDISRTS
jgi:hypothetical protein